MENHLRLNHCTLLPLSLFSAVCSYDVRAGGEDGVFKREKPVDGYWLDIEPSFIKSHKKKGKTTDRAELNSIEKKLAYGYKCELLEGENALNLQLVSLPSRPVRISSDPTNGRPIAHCTINGKLNVLKRVFVQAKQGLLGILPRVQHVLLFGEDSESGEPVMEKHVP
jgi:hypothetical protein